MNVYDLEEFAPQFFKIANKEGALISFQFNRAQRYVHQKIENQLKQLGYVRVLILKGRQQGISTYVGARFFHHSLLIPGTNAFILTHMGDATKNLFNMTKRYNNNLPKNFAPVPIKDNDNELVFDAPFNSCYRVGTAGSKKIGRSMTNQLLHLSEYAFYQDHEEIKTGIEQTVADVKGTEKIKESTAKGISNAFYEDWEAAKQGTSDYIPLFVPWYWQDEYVRDSVGMELTNEEKDWLMLYDKDGLTPRHLAWRRIKMADFKGDNEQKCRQFRQEYPFNDEEAFINSISDTFINVEDVQRARNAEVISEMPLVLGVDPARGGIDRSAIARRRGRKAYKDETHTGLNTMQLVGRVKHIIDTEHPVKVFIDCIGIGAGVVDRLHEMGYQQVVGINVSRTANNKDRFYNLRAELWSEMRDWFLQDMPVEIPDDPELQKELCCLGFEYTSDGKLKIESKKDAKEKRGLKSPDRADALMMTFAYGQYAGVSSYQENRVESRTGGKFS